jgi:hypothetical protein
MWRLEVRTRQGLLLGSRKVCIGNATLPALKTRAINEGGLPDEKLVVETLVVKW